MIPSISLSGLRTGLALAALSVTPAMFAAAPAASATPGAGTSTPAASIFTNAVLSPTADFRYQPNVSSSDDTIADNSPSSSLDAERDSLSFDGAQPPPGRRRSYGRSRYQDRLHNSDGSSKIAFVGGAGINIPVGNTAKFYTPHVAIVAGAGLNFNKNFGVLAEFHYDKMGLTGGTITNDYNNTLTYLAPYGATAADLAGFDANAHILSFSVNPIVNLVGQRKVGAYVTGGVGYYKKTTNFTLPQLSEDIYGDVYSENETFDSYSNGGLGLNGGVGLTYKLSEFSSERLFMEARYEWINLGKNSTDFFPYNNRNSEIIPVTVGIRF